MACGNSKHSVTGVSPFFAEHGYDPDTELAVISESLEEGSCFNFMYETEFWIWLD
jgi:hypothetical protein